MAEFLTTADMSAAVERIIKRAEHRVVIVSPYLKTRDRVRSLIKERSAKGVEVHIVYGKAELHDRERAWIEALPSVRLYFHKDLHAKCYMNESAAVLGSMNLYDFSQANNIEMGVLLEAQGDADAFEDVAEEAERIISNAQQRHPDAATPQADPAPPSQTEPPAGLRPGPPTPSSDTADNVPAQRGYCIRCNARIPSDTSRPYCVSCFKEWADAGKGTPSENYCHLGGKEAKVHFKRPACKPCWRQSRSRRHRKSA